MPLDPFTGKTEAQIKTENETRWGTQFLVQLKAKLGDLSTVQVKDDDGIPTGETRLESDYHIRGLDQIYEHINLALETVSGVSRQVQTRSILNVILSDPTLKVYHEHLNIIFSFDDPNDRRAVRMAATTSMEAIRQNQGNGNQNPGVEVDAGNNYIKVLQAAQNRQDKKRNPGQAKPPEHIRLEGEILKVRHDLAVRELALKMPPLGPDDINLIRETRQLRHDEAQLAYNAAVQKAKDATGWKAIALAKQEVTSRLKELKTADARNKSITDLLPSPREIEQAKVKRGLETDVSIAELTQQLEALKARGELPDGSIEATQARQIELELVRLGAEKTRWDTAKAKLAQLTAGESPDTIARRQAEIKALNSRIEEAAAKFTEWKNENQTAARDFTALLTIAEAQSRISGIERTADVGKSLRAGFEKYFQQFSDIIKNLDPDDPSTWGAGDEAQAAFVQSLMENAGQGINTWEDAIKLMAPLQAVYERQEARQRANERLRIEKEERDRRIQLEKEAAERIRKEEERIRLQEEGIGESGMAMQSAFTARATSGLVAPAAIDTTSAFTAAPPPAFEAAAAPATTTAAAAPATTTAAAPGGSPVGALLGDIVVENEPIGGGDPYHKSKELDLDGSDNNDAEEVIIEEISFMPPHPIKKFAPPVASGAPPIIINIGTGGFTPPII